MFHDPDRSLAQVRAEFRARYDILTDQYTLLAGCADCVRAADTERFKRILYGMSKIARERAAVARRLDTAEAELTIRAGRAA